MALLTKKEFAERCGITIKNLATYVTRHKVIYTKAERRGDERVNDAIEPNCSFLAYHAGKKYLKPKKEVPPKKLMVTRPPTIKEMLPVEMVAPTYKDEVEDEELPPGAAEYAGLDAKKVAKQIEKMEKEIEKLTLGNSKAKGQVVPIHLMDSVFLQERQSILMEAKNALQDILSIFGKKRDLTAYERADISAEFTDRLNEMMKRAAAVTEKAIDVIVREFSNKRAVGERN